MPATLYDFRDLDLMLKLRHEGDADGWVETRAMSEALGLGDNGLTVASRLSWMRRYGMLEFDDKTRMWRLTPGGERVTEAKLRGAQSRAIEAVPDEAIIEVLANVTSRYRHGDPMTAHLIRREFDYGTQRR
jgi:hypothetical protein